MTDETSNNNKKEEEEEQKLEKLKAGLFFAVITSFSILTGFGYSVSATKKKETKHYPKELEKKLHNLHSSGADLARKALFRATLYTFSGFSFFCLGVWKLSGASNFNEFRHKIGGVMPKLSKPSDKQGRTEFENLTDLFQYVIDEDNKSKQINNKNDVNK